MLKKYVHTLICATMLTGALAYGQDNDALTKDAELPESKFSNTTLHAQVLLDRALFSPGALDGYTGKNLERTIKDFQKAHDIEPTGTMDEKTMEALKKAGEDRSLTTEYKITKDDTETEFIDELPDEMADQADLDATAYTDIEEMLAERFHTTPEVLKELNPDAKYEADEKIKVPNVEPTYIRPDKKHLEAKDDLDETGKYVDTKGTELEEADDKDVVKVSGLMKKQIPDDDVTITVIKENSTLIVRDKDNKVIFRAPVTSGSKKDPLPIGEWKVNGTERYPKFNYNPELFWDADDSDDKAKIPHGPNNPVGVAWIDITKDHYGLHGTPEPTKIGYTESHGCVRLTNWDVLRLADMVKPETKVYFVETEDDDKLAKNGESDDESDSD